MATAPILTSSEETPRKRRLRNTAESAEHALIELTDRMAQLANQIDANDEAWEAKLAAREKQYEVRSTQQSSRAQQKIFAIDYGHPALWTPGSGWRAIRGDVPMLLHLVERTAGAKSGHLSDAQTANAVVRTPRSGARFWNLGDTQRQMEEARALTQQVIQAWSYTGEAEHSVPTASPPHGAECSTD